MLLVATVVAVILQSCNKENSETGNENGNQGVTPDGYVDLGLPSGTLWKTTDEKGYFQCDSAIDKYGCNLPTKEQFEELIALCQSDWDETKHGRTFLASNGKRIFFSASGSYGINGGLEEVGAGGYYWSSTSYNDQGYKWFFLFGSNGMWMRYVPKSRKLSVHLVRNN